MKYILATMITVLLVGCGNYSSTKNITTDNSVDNSVSDSGNTTNNGTGDSYNEDQNQTDELGVPLINAYSTGKIVLDCKDKDNIIGIAAYKCLKPNTKVSAVSTKGTLTKTDEYKVDDRFVMDFTINGVNDGDIITVRGIVNYNESNSSDILFGSATCEVGK